MHNELFSIGPFTVYGYGLMIAIGIIAALFIAEARGKKRGLVVDQIYNITITSVISGFIGAKLMFCIVDFKNFIQDPLSVLSSNGFVVYGGIILGVLAGYGFCKIKKLDFWRYFDIVLPSVAIAQAFGRIGCFLAGCCYGKVTDSFIGIAFTDSSFAPNGVKMIPTQLISSLGMFIIAAVLMIYDLKKRKSGTVGALYLILYSVGRFGVEFLRSDHRGEIGIFSTSQFISLFIVILGVVLFVLRSKQEDAVEVSDTDADKEDIVEEVEAEAAVDAVEVSNEEETVEELEEVVKEEVTEAVNEESSEQ